MKTYTCEEAKELYGKEVELCRPECNLDSKDSVCMRGQLTHNARFGWETWFYCSGIRFCKLMDISKWKIKVMGQNEFEVGEEVEVRDEEDGIRQPRIYLCTVPWNTRYPHIVVDCRFIEEYSKGKIFLNEDFRYIRKKEVQEKILEVTMKDICEKYWCNVKIIDDK